MSYFKIIVLFSLFGTVLNRKIFDVNDLLNVDFMPGSLLLLEGQTERVDDKIFGKNISKPVSYDVATSGSIMEAFSTMGYHRQVQKKSININILFIKYKNKTLGVA